MKRRSLILAPFVMALLAMPLQAEPISLGKLSQYLNDLVTSKSSFTQINPDGSIETGTLYIRRPGRMRFEYDPPSAALVMAGGGTVAIFDKKSNEPPQQFPLKRTPLSVILQRNVDLQKADMVTGHVSDENTTTVTAQDPENPDYGHIDLIFTGDPVELRQWVITDQSGERTTVILGTMEQGLDLKASLFSVQMEIQKAADKR